MTTWPPPPEVSEPGSHAKPSYIQRFLTWLFAVPPSNRTFWAIIWWWELRRIPYNFIVGSVGICSLLLFYFFITHSGALKAGEDAEEPLGIIAAPFLINICYTGGVLVEALIYWCDREKSYAVGPILMRIGLCFSLVVVMLPSLLWGLIWASHLH